MFYTLYHNDYEKATNDILLSTHIYTGILTRDHSLELVRSTLRRQLWMAQSVLPQRPTSLRPSWLFM